MMRFFVLSVKNFLTRNIAPINKPGMVSVANFVYLVQLNVRERFFDFFLQWQKISETSEFLDNNRFLLILIFLC